MPLASMSWLRLLFFTVLAVQDSTLPNEGTAKLDEVLKALDADEAGSREAAQRRLHELYAQYGTALVDALKKRSAGAPIQVKASIDVFLAYRERVVKARKTVSAFDALETPDLKGKRFVLFNTGGYMTQGETIDFEYHYGWLLGETKESVHLADESFTRDDFPRWRKLPDGWDKVKEKHPKNAPLPGDYVEVDFDLFCKEMISTGTAPSTHLFAKREKIYLVSTAIYSYWAFKRGSDDAGIKLLDLVDEAFKGPHNDWVKSMASVSDLLECSMVQQLRVRAIRAAQGGEEREDLVKMWKRIGDRLPEKEYPGEAKAMVRYYEELLKEDKAWVEPKKEDLAKFTVSQKVDYWMYQLRELACSQRDDPGECDVLQKGFSREKDDPLNAAQELVQLGTAALPAIIEHLDDERPTRSVGWHRSFNPGTYYLLRYGDCCEQIFYAITKQVIYSRSSTNGYPIKDGQGARLKKKAQEWWEAKQKK